MPKKINGEIWGHGEIQVGADGKVRPAVGGSHVGSPGAKRDAKHLASRMRRTIDKKVLASNLKEDASGKHVVIGNAGHGRQNMWPSSMKPGAYSKKTAEAHAARLNASRSPHSFTQIHYHVKPLETAHEYVMGGQPAAYGLRNLQDKHRLSEDWIEGPVVEAATGKLKPPAHKVIKDFLNWSGLHTEKDLKGGFVSPHHIHKYIKHGQDSRWDDAHVRSILMPKINEDEGVAANHAGSAMGTNIAGIGNNPPGKQRRLKNLDQVLKRVPPVGIAATPTELKMYRKLAKNKYGAPR